MHLLLTAFFTSIAAMLMATLASAQSDGGCEATVLDNPPRTQLTCPNGVKIVAEDGTTFSLEDRDPSAPGPEAINLDGQGVMVEVQPGGAGFEVNTPQAIAAVRGTRWVVDVNEGSTSVLVMEGKVAVKRAADDPAIMLGPGEGVDVEEGARSALSPRRWSEERKDAMLARFGE